MSTSAITCPSYPLACIQFPLPLPPATPFPPAVTHCDKNQLKKPWGKPQICGQLGFGLLPQQWTEIHTHTHTPRETDRRTEVACATKMHRRIGQKASARASGASHKHVPADRAPIYFYFSPLHFHTSTERGPKKKMGRRRLGLKNDHRPLHKKCNNSNGQKSGAEMRSLLQKFMQKSARAKAKKNQCNSHRKQAANGGSAKGEQGVLKNPRVQRRLKSLIIALNALLWLKKRTQKSLGKNAKIRTGLETTGAPLGRGQSVSPSCAVSRPEWKWPSLIFTLFRSFFFATMARTLICSAG